MIQITSKKEGFRRCGIEHSAEPKLYKDDHFTPEQLEKLKAEPMLIVVEVEDKSKGKADKLGKEKNAGTPGNDQDPKKDKDTTGADNNDKE